MPGGTAEWRAALHAEWTKLRTVGTTYWLAATALAGTIAFGILASATARCGGPGCAGDPARICLTGVQFGQAVLAVLGAMAVGAEYQSGMIRVTYAAMPHRGVVLAAKAAVVALVAAAVGIVAVGVSVAAGVGLVQAHGFTAANGFGDFGFAAGAGLWRAAAGSVVYLVAVAVLGVGVAAVVRDGGVAVGAVLGVLYLFPIVTSVVGDPDWHRCLERIGPMSAGLAVQNTVRVGEQVVAPWTGLGIAVCWAAAALVAAWGWQRARDA
jgi:ABC-2 type transport system permease protein